MIYNLLVFFEGIEIYFPSWLDPFKVEVRIKLLSIRENTILLLLFKKFTNQLWIVSFPNKNILHFLLYLCTSRNIIQSWVCKNREFITNPLIIPIIKPFMLRAVTFKDTFEPLINGSKVKLNTMIEFGLKLITLKHLYSAFLPPSSNRFPFSEVDFNVDHLMRERFQFRIGIGCTIEN